MIGPQRACWTCFSEFLICAGVRECVIMLAAVVCATLCGFRGVQPVVLWLNTHGSAM